jgi:hypothetical protein
MTGQTVPVTKLVAPNLALAWKRLYAMATPMEAAKKNKIVFYQICATGTWPALCYFGHYTMVKDYPEHAARHALVNKKMPYMANPSNVVYKWGTPCTLFDFDCAYNHRKSLE